MFGYGVSIITGNLECVGISRHEPVAPGMLEVVEYFSGLQVKPLARCPLGAIFKVQRLFERMVRRRLDPADNPQWVRIAGLERVAASVDVLRAANLHKPSTVRGLKDEID